ncbi:hypothetical protein HYX12_04890, partial [Candidatus Woesearchaeota archaeon]|nr:hypothetical protein [Candidatus Woesearchaeota archaeon]
MVLSFHQKLDESLKKINSLEHREMVVYGEEKERTFSNSDEVISHYGDLKWMIIDLINETFNTSFCLS